MKKEAAKHFFFCLFSFFLSFFLSQSFTRRMSERESEWVRTDIRDDSGLTLCRFFAGCSYVKLRLGRREWVSEELREVGNCYAWSVAVASTTQSSARFSAAIIRSPPLNMTTAGRAKAREAKSSTRRTCVCGLFFSPEADRHIYRVSNAHRSN